MNKILYITLLLSASGCLIASDVDTSWMTTDDADTSWMTASINTPSTNSSSISPTGSFSGASAFSVVTIMPGKTARVYLEDARAERKFKQAAARQAKKQQAVRSNALRSAAIAAAKREKIAATQEFARTVAAGKAEARAIQLAARAEQRAFQDAQARIAEEQAKYTWF